MITPVLGYLPVLACGTALTGDNSITKVMFRLNRFYIFKH
jgi:hypothetical protein